MFGQVFHDGNSNQFLFRIVESLKIQTADTAPVGLQKEHTSVLTSIPIRVSEGAQGKIIDDGSSDFFYFFAILPLPMLLCSWSPTSQHFLFLLCKELTRTKT